jgi:hypothetical protein
MKSNCRKILAAVVLALIITTPALAGDGIIWTEFAPPPPPAMGGTTQTDDTLSTSEAADALTEIGLSLLEGLLTRF